MPEPRHDPGILRLPLAAVALGCGILALASLGTLVTVVALQDIDALSTVALALAIIAFVAQLIIFIFQAAETNRQAHDGQELHNRLYALTRQIEERTSGTQKQVDTINSRLIEALIGKAAREGLPPASREFARVVADGIAAESELQNPGVPPSRHKWPPPLPAAEAGEIHRELSEWPNSEEVEEVASILMELDEDAQRSFAVHSADVFETTVPEASVGPGMTGVPFVTQELVEKGLVEEVMGWNGQYTLTPTGRKVGRLLTAEGRPPPYIGNELMQLRERLRSWAYDPD